MDDTVKSVADARTAEAIATSRYEDFREAYRDRLRWLKEARPQAFSEALASYDKLVESVAGGSDPLRGWLEYGRQLGELSGRGKVVGIDATGREVSVETGAEQLILHLPDDINVPALPLAVPRNPSDAQQSTLELLVLRKLS